MRPLTQGREERFAEMRERVSSLRSERKKPKKPKEPRPSGQPGHRKTYCECKGCKGQRFAKNEDRLRAIRFREWVRSQKRFLDGKPKTG
jgi:hypothetical protein